MQPDSLPDAPEGVNQDVADALREIAAWLEAHPELYRARALVTFHPYGDECRPVLTALAQALGYRATERVERGERVVIEGEFGERVRVIGDASLRYLGVLVEPPAPAYEPIIPPVRLSDALTESALDLAGRDTEDAA